MRYQGTGPGHQLANATGRRGTEVRPHLNMDAAGTPHLSPGVRSGRRTCGMEICTIGNVANVYTGDGPIAVAAQVRFTGLCITLHPDISVCETSNDDAFGHAISFMRSPCYMLLVWFKSYITGSLGGRSGEEPPARDTSVPRLGK
jgi:hypothetical protein